MLHVQVKLTIAIVKILTHLTFKRSHGIIKYKVIKQKSFFTKDRATENFCVFNAVQYISKIKMLFHVSRNMAEKSR